MSKKTVLAEKHKDIFSDFSQIQFSLTQFRKHSFHAICAQNKSFIINEFYLWYRTLKSINYHCNSEYEVKTMIQCEKWLPLTLDILSFHYIYHRKIYSQGVMPGSKCSSAGLKNIFTWLFCIWADSQLESPQLPSIVTQCRASSTQF